MEVLIAIEPSLKSKSFHKFVQNSDNAGDKYTGPNRELYTKDFQTDVDGQKYVVLKWQTRRDSGEIIIRPRSGLANDKEYEVIYRKLENHPRPSYNRYPLHDDNSSYIDPGTEEDRRIIRMVKARQRCMRNKR